MNHDKGFIAVYRSLLDWEWYTNVTMLKMFIHCILKANYKEKKWQGITIEKGSFITTVRGLAKETGLSVQQVRTTLDKLKSTQEITQTTTQGFTLIYVVNYNKYQNMVTNDNTVYNTESNTRATHTNKDNNINKETIVTNNKEIYCLTSDIIDYLNLKTGKQFKAATKETSKLIKTRINAKFALEDFKKVIDFKSSQWLSDKEMNKYLQPSTLFGNKFERYLEEAENSQLNYLTCNEEQIYNMEDFINEEDIR